MSCYAGYVKDPNILSIAQSGGFVSALLIHGLQNGDFQGAVVSKWSYSPNLHPVTYIATTRDEVLAAVGSKYNAVPACAILPEILAFPGKVAFVGTSCQIHAMRKAEQLIPKLRKKIALYIGLHCLGVFTYHFFDDIFTRLRVRKEEIVYFRHRDKAWRGWPCDMRIVTAQGRVVDLVAQKSRLWPRPFYTNWRCRLCFDKANEFADISCGDCRVPIAMEELRIRGYDIARGVSEVVVRTKRGNDAMQSLIQAGEFEAFQLEPNAVAESVGATGKKLGMTFFSHAARRMGMGAPRFGMHYELCATPGGLRSSLYRACNVIAATMYFFVYWLSQFRLTRAVLRHVPFKLFYYIQALTERPMVWSRFAKATEIRLVVEQTSTETPDKTSMA